MLDYVYLGLYKFFGFLLWILPDGFIRLLMLGLAWFAYTFSTKHQKIISSNLDIAFHPSLAYEEKKSIGIAAFMNLIDTVFGIIRRDSMSKDEVIRNIDFEGSEIIERYQKEKKNFILVTGHYGNWELLSQSIAIRFRLTLVGVGRKMDSDAMDKILKKNRERFNVEMIYKNGAIKGCIKSINQGKTIGILTDQSIRKSQSVDVVFFGKTTTHTPLASILARKFEIDMIPIYISTDDYKQYTVKVQKPIKYIKTDNQEEDLVILTQLQASVTEKVIKEDPKQWFWMHNRWK